jgi:small subunit ribosomal protein S4e
MKKHLKRLRTPKFWQVKKKEKKWTVRPRPGPHKMFESIPLLVLVRDILNVADKGKEARKIIKSREILVDGKARRDYKYPVGLMDVVSIPKLGKHYRAVPSKRGLGIIEIPKAEVGKKICRINDKKILRGNRTQLNCHDGRNIVSTDKGKDYKTGDSVLIELPSQKIIEYIELGKGSLVLITKGKNAGMLASVKKLSKATVKEPAKAACVMEGEKEETDVDKNYVFVVGQKKPLIKVS